MALSDPSKLAQYVRSLPDFVINENIDCNYNHIGATIADAVLQRNMRYKTHVKPRVNRILSTYPKSRTTKEVLRLLETVSAIEYLDWHGEDRAKCFSHILGLFARENIETEVELQVWLSKEANLKKLRSIKYIGPKTVDYFKLLVGISTSAIDRHLLDFLEQAGFGRCGYDGAQSLINDTADILGVDRAHFDHSIWQYMTKCS